MRWRAVAVGAAAMALECFGCAQDLQGPSFLLLAAAMAQGLQ